mgnify:CR=1 FL=1
MYYVTPHQYQDTQLLKPILMKRINTPIGLYFQNYGVHKGYDLKGKITRVTHDGFYFKIADSNEIKFYYFKDVASWRHFLFDDFIDMSETTRF